MFKSISHIYTSADAVNSVKDDVAFLREHAKAKTFRSVATKFFAMNYADGIIKYAKNIIICWLEFSTYVRLTTVKPSLHNLRFYTEQILDG